MISNAILKLNYCRDWGCFDPGSRKGASSDHRHEAYQYFLANRGRRISHMVCRTLPKGGVSSRQKYPLRDSTKNAHLHTVGRWMLQDKFDVVRCDSLMFSFPHQEEYDRLEKYRNTIEYPMIPLRDQREEVERNTLGISPITTS